MWSASNMVNTARNPALEQTTLGFPHLAFAIWAFFKFTIFDVFIEKYHNFCLKEEQKSYPIWKLTMVLQKKNGLLQLIHGNHKWTIILLQ